MNHEIYFSVDVETSGPIPGEYNLLSIGACVVGANAQRFYMELAPVTDNFTTEAMALSAVTLAELRERGAPPRDAMAQFAAWTRAQAHDARAVFVGFNAAFDWSFVNYYFVKFLGVDANPFGYMALDIKSYAMGVYNTTFGATSMRHLPPEIHPPNTPLSHNALDDAIQQAEIFERLLKRASRRK
ncbi:MAG: DNA polymerase III subunit epsilon [Chloroflexi bacterium]|nr:MAG: DNA polymerase III subunit epsilon [Chloroflexota bacterium]